MQVSSDTEKADSPPPPPDNSSIDISILIVSWNSRYYLEQCLKSLEVNQTGNLTFEVIVVDNASVDGSGDMIAQNFPWVKLICNTYNYGFARATNQAYQISRGRYVMTLNPDTYLPPGTLEQIIKFFDTHPDAGAAQPRPSYTRFNRWHKPNLWKILKGLVRSTPSSSPPPSNPERVEWLWGTGIIARREVLSDKFYDEWSFLFCEEYDFCKNIQKNGYKLYLLPFSMEHFLGKSRKRSPEIQYAAQKLSQAAVFVMECREIGTFRARINSLLKVMDGILLWLSQSVIQLIKPKPERIESIIEWKALWVANLLLLIRGKSYFNKINLHVEKVLNNRSLLRKWIIISES